MKKQFAVCVFGGLNLIAFNPCIAQTFPTRPIRLVVPFPPGGALDVLGRIVAAQVEKQIGQPVVIDNRGGANGVIGSEIVAKSAPDGYTLMNNGAALLVAQILNPALPFDIERDFTPITSIGHGTGYMLAVNASSPAKSVQEFVAMARNAATPISYGSAGVGNPNHLAPALFAARAGIDATHVPYRGTAPSINALMSGEVQFIFSSPPAILPQVKSGRLRILAFTGVTRSAALPNVPTMIEAGVKGYVFDGGFVGWHAPSGTPASVIRKLQTEVQKALRLTVIREAIEIGGYLPGGEAPEEFGKFIRTQMSIFQAAVKVANLEKQ